MKTFPMYAVTLTAAFVVLDATGKIDWAWWQVTAPLLFAIVISLLVALAALTINEDKQK